VLRTDDRGIPVGSEPVKGTSYDFGKAKPIGAAKLDHAFTDLEREEDGLARVELTDPERGATLSLWVTRAIRICSSSRETRSRMSRAGAWPSSR
jgi:hypothetical protein